MGIKDLTVFLKEFAPNSISKGNLSHINSILKTQRPDGKMRAAIDTSLFLYKYKYRSGDNFINEFLEQINRLLINNIEPIYVFDGAPPTEKKDTLKQRKDRKESYLIKIKELESQIDQLKQNDELSGDIQQSKKEIEKNLLEEISKIKRKTIFVTAEDNNKLLYFLDIMNIKHIKRDMEADIVCSKLSSEGLIELVISEDMDHLTSGTKILLRDFNNKNNYVTVYNLNTMLTCLNFNSEMFIILCILFGCDYVSRIRGLGYKSSYKIIKGINDTNTSSQQKVSDTNIKDTIENKDVVDIDTLISKILQSKKLVIPDDFKNKFTKAQNIFRNNITLNVDEEFFNNNNEIFDNQVKVVKDYLVKYTSFTEQKIKNRLKNIFGYCI